MVKSISVNENNLLIELDELEAKILSRSLPLVGPMFAQFIYMMARLVLLVVTLGKDDYKRLQERIERGDDLSHIFSDMGINLNLESLFDKSIEWPTEEEIDRALGWLDKQ